MLCKFGRHDDFVKEEGQNNPAGDRRKGNKCILPNELSQTQELKASYSGGR